MSTLIDTSGAAAMCGLRASTLHRWRIQGVGPEFLKLGAAIRYRVEDVEAWIESRRRTSTRSSEPDSRTEQKELASTSRT